MPKIKQDESETIPVTRYVDRELLRRLKTRMPTAHVSTLVRAGLVALDNLSTGDFEELVYAQRTRDLELERERAATKE